MKKPEMIIFDYGHTLLYEPGFNAIRCEEAAYPYIVENPQNLTIEQIYAEVQRVFAEFQDQRDAGIRTAVISNIGWSGIALTNRINRLLPDNRFEFIMASSEYVIRKPNRMLFETALRKANLPADAVWYCGDNIRADIKGAQETGIFPVLYEGNTPDEVNPVTYQNEGQTIDFDYLHIHDWNEMIAVLSTVGSN